MNLELLRLKRLSKGYKQKELSELMGISRASYSSKENGRRDFTSRDMRELIDLLGLNQSDIVEIFFADVLAA